MNEAPTPSPRYWIRPVLVFLAFVFTMAGAAYVHISSLASNGYLLAFTGPLYLGICLPVLFGTITYSWPPEPPGVGKWGSIFICTSVAFLFATGFGWVIGWLINEVYFQIPISDDHLP